MAGSLFCLVQKYSVVNSYNTYTWEKIIVQMQRHCLSVQGWSCKAKAHLELHLAKNVKVTRRVSMGLQVAKGRVGSTCAHC